MRFFLAHFQVYRRALSLLWKVSPTLVSVQLVLQGLLSFLPLGILYATQGLFDSFLKSEGVDSIAPFGYWLLGLGALQLAQTILSQVNSYFASIFTQKLSDSTSTWILEKSVAIPFPYFEDANYHDSLHLAQKQSIYKLPQLFSQFQAVFSNGLSLALLVGYFLSVLSTFAWLILVFAIPVAVIKWYSGFALHRLEKKQVGKEREANYLHSILTGESFALEVRTLNFGDRLIEKFGKIRKSIYSEKNRLNKRLTFFSAFAESAEVMVFLFILYRLSQGAMQGTFTWGLLVVYIQGIQKLQGNLKGFLNAAVSLIQQRIFLADLFRFLDIPVPQSQQHHSFLPQSNLGVSVNQVSFQYPGSPQLALDQVSMVFPKGKVIGIVGANGSGKSTLVKLIAGMYQPMQGEILASGVPLSSWNPKKWREQTLFLFQDFQKYFFSIQEIVALGPEQQHTDSEKVQDALRKAEAWEFVAQLDRGVKSKLGRVFLDGKGLSGGQWQKLAISRAFYRKPELLVLDEPTSGIDAMAETHIFNRIRENAKDRATILITHRLYNLKEADYIYVLDQGKVVQEGKFDQLSIQEGIFNQLFSNQKFG